MVLLFLIFMQTGIRRKDVSGCPAREPKGRMPAGTGAGTRRKDASGHRRGSPKGEDQWASRTGAG